MESIENQKNLLSLCQDLHGDSNMKTINQQLDELFVRWKEAFFENGEPSSDGLPLFTADGIMRKANVSDENLDAIWKKSDRRVVFLLKDQNQNIPPEYQWSEDIRDWFVVNRSILNLRSIKKLGYLLYGLTNVSKERSVEFDCITFDNLKDVYENTAFAFIETKKSPGGKSIKDSELSIKINLYSNLLKEELDILGANIVVCCGRPQHRFMLETYFEKNHPWTYSSQNVHYDQRSNILVVLAYHPSYRIGYKNNYNWCMQWVRILVNEFPYLF